MDDAAAVAAIAGVRGMGPWTAEVYLLFALERPDVFPAGDLALAGACAALKRLNGRPGPVALRAIAARGSRGGRWRRGCCGITGVT